MEPSGPPGSSRRSPLKKTSTSSSSSSSNSPRPPNMTTTIPLPIPAPSNAYNPSRSPSSSSLSPYRSHPYSRQPPESLPRIHLPAPNSRAPLNVGIPDPSPPISNLALNSPPWRTEPQPRLHRTLSSSARGLTLPPLHTISPGASTMAPPPLTSPSSSFERGYPQPSSSLRPSYAGYEPQPPQAGPSRWREDPYASEARSPSLRALPVSRSFSPERYPLYFPPVTATGRSTNQSTTSRRSEEAEMTREIGSGTGQNRRVAHLMSEQKRRE